MAEELIPITEGQGTPAEARRNGGEADGPAVRPYLDATTAEGILDWIKWSSLR